MADSVLFVQRKPHRAGAQTCLARLLRADAVRRWNPVLLCSEPGWLTEECAAIDIPVVVEKFPSSRSLRARLFGNGRFARRAAAVLHERGFSPSIIQANDHLEGILGLAVAQKFGAKTSILLRSPGTSRADYFKYRANEYDAISAIGDDLTARIRQWHPASNVQLSYDGLLEEEFLVPKLLADKAPPKVLVIGSPLAWKGWRDLVDAVVTLEQNGSIANMEFHFTGVEPDRAHNDLGLERLSNTKTRFLGRVEKFRELMSGYELVINPSRMETFGMAAVETLAAGVPLLSSRTGVIERVQNDPAMLFVAGDAAGLARALSSLLIHWSETDFNRTGIQARIREQFHIDRAAAQFDAIYRGLLPSRAL